MWTPTKPFSVFVSIIFTLVWATLVAISIPYVIDAYAHYKEAGIARLFIVGITIVLASYWTFIGIRWGYDDWVGNTINRRVPKLFNPNLEGSARREQNERLG